VDINKTRRSPVNGLSIDNWIISVGQQHTPATIIGRFQSIISFCVNVLQSITAVAAFT